LVTRLESLTILVNQVNGDNNPREFKDLVVNQEAVFEDHKDSQIGRLSTPMKRAKRIIWRDKTYGFHPWRDQVDAIDQIVKESGTKEAIVLRKLIDEALAARSRKGASQELEASTAREPKADSLQAIQALLVELVEHAEKSMRVQDVGLALLQDTLAEARAGRKVSWEQLASNLKERGLSAKDLRRRFDDETAEARDFAYSAAKEIKDSQTR